MTTLGFSPQITRPTRLPGDSNTLIDHIFTNNFCKQHLAGILVTPVSDHLMQFCIVKGRQGRNINNFPKCIEVENINPLSINNFKHAILKSNIYEKLVKNPDSDPNQNYEIFSSALIEAKTNHPYTNFQFYQSLITLNEWPEITV